MATRVRQYILEESGAIKRVPQRLVDALVFGKDAILEYAGTRQRVAQIVIENENGKPVRILGAKGTYWIFDDKGQIDAGLRQSASVAMEFAFEPYAKRDDNVVDLQPALKRKEFKEEHCWEVTFEDLTRIAADLWPDAGGGPKIKTVRGKAQVKLPRGAFRTRSDPSE
jgi:hypothetical protein